MEKSNRWQHSVRASLLPTGLEIKRKGGRETNGGKNTRNSIWNQLENQVFGKIYGTLLLLFNLCTFYVRKYCVFLLRYLILFKKLRTFGEHFILVIRQNNRLIVSPRFWSRGFISIYVCISLDLLNGIVHRL